MINTDLEDQFIEEFERKLQNKLNNQTNQSPISSQANFDANDRLNTDAINSNQIQNLYNYIIKIREKNKILSSKCQGFEQMKIEIEEKTKKLKENEEYIKMILYENKLMKLKISKLHIRTEEYQIQLTDWEKNLNEIMIKLNNLEEENKRLYDDNKLLKAKNNEILSQIKNIKEKEPSYETTISNLKKENLDKIKILDDKLNFQIKQLEFEYKQKYDKMASQIRELERKNEKLTRDNTILMEQFSESDKFFKSKEIEFEKVMNFKDEKLRELEKCLSIISKETENQNLKIKQNLNEYFIKEEQMKKYIFQIENQIEILNKKLSEKEKIIRFLEEKISVLIPTNVYKNDYNNISNY